MASAQATQLQLLTFTFAAILDLHKSRQKDMTKKKSPVKKKRTPVSAVTKKTQQLKNLIWHVDFLHKEDYTQRQQIFKQQATITKQEDLIRKMKVQLKKLKAPASKKTVKAVKSMKAK